MTADTLKTTRVLELYQDFLSGKLINKQQAAEQYHVNVRSIQRDIDSIRDFLSEQCAKEGIVRKIEYDKKENGYRLVTQEIEQLSKGEVLALCKILLESRAFNSAFTSFKNNESRYKDKSQLLGLVSTTLFAYDAGRLFNETLIFYNHVYSYIFNKLDDNGKLELTKYSIECERKQG